MLDVLAYAGLRDGDLARSLCVADWDLNSDIDLFVGSAPGIVRLLGASLMADLWSALHTKVLIHRKPLGCDIRLCRSTVVASSGR